MNGLSPLLLVHIFSATIGLLSGFLSMLVRKGSGLHRVAGQAFFVSMLTMSSSAVIYAVFIHPIRINVVAGSLTFYLVATGWWSGRRRAAGTGAFDRLAFGLIIIVALIAFASSIQAAASPERAINGVPVFAFLIFGAGTIFAIRSDVRLFRSGGVTGSARIARHLYRMSFALLIAVFSLFPGQGKLFPTSWKQSGLLLLPHVLIVVSMLVWRRRLRGKTRSADLVAQPHNAAGALLHRQQLQPAGGHAAILDVEQ